MRKDMKHVIVNTGRNGGWGKDGMSRRARLKNTPDDEVPTRITSSRHRCGDRSLGDRIRPLFNMLKANCGRNWDNVYREICATADMRTIRGFHLRQHVWAYVVPNNYDVGHSRRYGPFFVDTDGTLQQEKPRNPSRRISKGNPRLVEDADHWWEKIEGYWYWFETKHWVTKNSREDLAEVDGEVVIVRIPLRDVHHHETGKRQVNGKAQKELDRRWLSLRKAA